MNRYTFNVNGRRYAVDARTEPEAWVIINWKHSEDWVELESVVPVRPSHLHETRT